ncbi:MAG: hypothetical protein GY805_34360 [Chloroflexi bacterium]|nr:hypothetical protein [Chloroflexota bacterium]
MGRNANRKDRKKLRAAIEENPLQRKGWFARLLDWHPQKVERELAYLHEDNYLLVEDDNGRIWPFGN